MLRKIDVGQLEVGMYLEEFCCSWMEHPFWRSGFIISDTQDIERIRNCNVAEVWIDSSKGVDVAPEKRSVTLAEAEADAATELSAIVAECPSPVDAIASGEQDYRHAAEICREARHVATEIFAQARMGRAVDADGARQVVDSVLETITRDPCTLLNLVRLKTASEFTYMHSVAACVLMVSLARQLGFDEGQTRASGLAGLLHDIGKAALPLDVLHKPESLDDHEFAIVRRHPQEGLRMLKQCGLDGVALDVCLNHHTRIDGSGYPHGIKGNDIGVHARMASVCDVYDAISSGRPYKSAWDPAESIHRMAEWSKGHFDQVVFHAFVKTIGIYPVGALVRLKSRRLGVVVSQSAHSLLTPSVKVFFSTRANARIPVEVVDLASAGCDEAIEAREDPAKWNFPDLVELWSGLRGTPW